MSLAGFCFGSNDLHKAGQFYDRVLATIDYQRRFENDLEIGYGKANAEPDFWILLPYNKQAASVGNGSQVMFVAASQQQVDAFYSQAITAGGADEGKPGLRDYRPGYYGAYCRDLDGNKLHVFTMLENALY